MAVSFLLGNSPASEFYMSTFRNTVPSSREGRCEDDWGQTEPIHSVNWGGGGGGVWGIPRSASRRPPVCWPFLRLTPKL